MLRSPSGRQGNYCRSEQGPRLECSGIGGTIAGQGAMSDIANLILNVGYAVIGLGLIFWAAPLSIRYNAWTTGLRERHPHINPPPTPEWRARNTKIMTVMFRVFGVFVVLLSIIYFLPLMITKLR